MMGSYYLRGLGFSLMHPPPDDYFLKNQQLPDPIFLRIEKSDYNSILKTSYPPSSSPEVLPSTNAPSRHEKEDKYHW